jgi:glycosyltransferase involved in cell wall biosynthesis
MTASIGGSRESGLWVGESGSRTALLIATDLGPGSTREVMVLIADELRSHGIDVELAVLCRGQNSDASVPCEVLVDSERLTATDYPRAFVRLARRIRRGRPGAILSFLPEANILGALSGVMMGVPIRVATHHQPSSRHSPLVRGLDRLLGSIGGYSHVVAMSESIHSSLKDYPPSYLKRERLIRNTVRPIAPTYDRLAVRRHFGFRSDALLLVVIGRLEEGENLFNMLAGASHLAGIQLALVGDGPLRPEIERLISQLNLDGKVFLVGQVERQLAADILFAADVFIQVGTFEGRSSALLQAIHAEKAIVVSDIPSQRETLTMEDGSLAGLVCDPSDVGSIASTLSDVVTNEKLRRDLVAKAGMLKREFDPMRMGRAYAFLLTSRRAARRYCRAAAT